MIITSCKLTAMHKKCIAVKLCLKLYVVEKLHKFQRVFSTYIAIDIFVIRMYNYREDTVDFYLFVKEINMKIKKLTSDLTKTIMDEQKEELQAKGVKYVNIHLPQNILGFTSTQKYWPPLRHKIFLYSTFFIGGVITLFTLIWGVL